MCNTALQVWPELKLPDFVVELPKNPNHGDYASNLAMLLAKPLKLPPREIATSLCREIQDPKGFVESTQIAGPGFINLTVSKTCLAQVIPAVLEAGNAYGQHPANSKKVLIEFVSANPTGPLHLGHARPAFLGDGVARLLKAAGYEVTKEFYVNDAGNQIETLGESIYLRYLELHGQSVKLPENAYPGAYVIEIAKKLQEQDGDKWLKQKDYLKRCVQIGIEENLKLIKQTLEKADIEFDSWYFESSIHERGEIARLIEQFRKREMLYEADQAKKTLGKVRRETSNAAKYAHQQVGGTFLKTSEFGDEEDRVILRKDGRPVYLTADIFYHQEKFNRNFDRIIDVFGADHAGHVPRMQACLKALGLDASKLEFLLAQMVRLIRGGKEIRFSKRTGQIIELSEFIEEVGSDVARVIFLSRAPNTQFDFDLDLALKQSSENPVFYLQYGHARMATILKKAGVDVRLGWHDSCSNLLNLPEERNMIKKMAAYPEVILSSATSLEPHRVLFYCQDLIAEFHSYFTKYRHSEKIISESKELTAARLVLIQAMKQTIFNALNLFGIHAPEHMTHEE